MITNGISITPSLVIEYMYCPRFIYYMKVLNIKQHEDLRYKVQKGRTIHKQKTTINPDYLRKKIGVIRKETEEELASIHNRIHGKVDEILFLNDGSAAPLDYKYAEYKGKVYKTYKTQSIIYGLLIKENYSIDVNRGYIVYTRSNHHMEEIKYQPKDIKQVLKNIDTILKIIELNYFPKKTAVKNRCNDCCYRNICVQ